MRKRQYEPTDRRPRFFGTLWKKWKVKMSVTSPEVNSVALTKMKEGKNANKTTLT